MMKRNIIIILFLFCAFACKGKCESVVITGKIAPYKDDLMIIAQQTSIYSKDTLHVKPDGSFEYSIDISEPEQVNLYCYTDPVKVVMCYVVPGAPLNVNIVNNVFSFDGETRIECEYMNLPYHRYKFKDDDGNVVSYLDFQKQVAVQQRLLREKLSGTRKEFAEKKNEEIDYMPFNLSFMYANSVLENGSKPEEDADFMKFISGIDINDDSYYQNRNYTYNIIEEVVRIQIRINAEIYGSLDGYTAKFNYLRDNMSNVELRTKIADNTMDILMALGGDDNLERSFAAYKEISDTSAIFKKNERIYESLRKLLPGVPATDFIMKDTEGNEIRFLDVIGKGKIVYIDFWATWCGPCCLQIPFVEKLVEEYADNPDIEFISISLDKNTECWLDKLEQDKPLWKQFIIPDNFDSPFARQYNVRGIPRFMIFDKEGKIININAPVPSSPTIRLYLDSILGKVEK